ncbi:MAG: 3-phosphoshikimate 1-carboxyvinyltransferase, partial [Actinomycetia bacterium]|nr:3-phosphoshikimate 1-carboxyvinyltransferase [Actinomycetes bacterium]
MTIVGLPGDKSISHRALLLGMLAEGETVVEGLLQAEDVQATMAAVRALGAKVTETGGQGDAPIRHRILGTGGALQDPIAAIDCGNSGTLARLLFGILCAREVTACMVGDASLSSRPMGRVVDPLASELGAAILHRSMHYGASPRLPLTVSGRLPNAPLDISASIASAQVKTAILFAALQAPGMNVVTLPAGSRDHSERMLAAFGVTCTRMLLEGSERISMAGQQRLRAPSEMLVVPRDVSAAAFPLCAIAGMSAVGTGADRGYVLPDIGFNPTRDGVLRVLDAMGCELLDAAAGESLEFLDPQAAEQGFVGEAMRDIRLSPPQVLRPIDCPLAWVPQAIDEFPVLFVLAAKAHGVSTFRALEELRVKESDRIELMVDGLRRIGVKVESGDDWVTIHGDGRIAGGNSVPIDVALDHRIAMAFAVAGMLADAPVLVGNDSPIMTSF